MNTIRIVSQIIGMIGMCVIVYGVLVAVIQFFKLEYSRLRGIKKEILEPLRHQLGAYMLLGLEILIAADIIGTITHPTLKDMALLASIVAIRTVISYFLNRESAFSVPQSEKKSHRL